MRTSSRQFGTPRYLSGGQSSIIYKGTIDDATVVELQLEAGGLYELFTAEYNASTGAYRGHRSRLIKAPEEELFGTTASATVNESASTNSGVTITMNADSSVSVSRSSATYAVKYVLRAVGINIGNVSSAVSSAEAAAATAQNYATAAEGSAGAAANSASEAAGYVSDALAAIEHYPKIENGYWYVWDAVNSAWISTGVPATGETGATPNLTIGTVETGAAGSSAEASITGTAEDPVLNLKIPRGNAGVSGGIQIESVWDNPAPTSNFAAQTVEVDLTDYDAVLIKSRNTTSGEFSNNLCMKDEATTLFGANAASTEYRYKRVATVNDSGVAFGNGFRGTASSAGYLIPQKIFGVRGIVL